MGRDKRKLNKAEKNAVVAAYTKKGGSLQSVAKQLNMGQDLVGRTLKEEGIELKGQANPGAGGCPTCKQPCGFHLSWCEG